MGSFRVFATEIAIPPATMEELGNPQSFDVTVEAGRLVPTPSKATPLDLTTRKLEDLGVSEVDLEDAVRWDWRPVQIGNGALDVVLHTDITTSALVFGGRLAWLRHARSTQPCNRSCARKPPPSFRG